MTNEEVRIFAERFYDLKCAAYDESSSTNEKRGQWNYAAETIQHLVTSRIFHAVDTADRKRMANMFHTIDQRAREGAMNSVQKHWLGELDDIFDAYGLMN